MRVMNAIGHGYLEKIYENALAIDFRKNDIAFAQQQEFPLSYEGELIGTFIPDFIVFDKIIVEIKAVDKITEREIGQVINYLKTTKLELGVLLNFKNQKLEWKRIVL